MAFCVILYPDSKGNEAPAWLPPVPVIIWPQDWKRYQMFTS